LKGYVIDAINAEVREDVSAIAEEIKRFQSEQAAARVAAGRSEAEGRASDTDALQVKQLDAEALSPEEEEQRNENLRDLALTLKRESETGEQAFERVKASKYLINFKYDEQLPFYQVEYRFGRVIVTINTAHPFFDKLYAPLKRATAKAAEGEAGEIPSAAEGPDGLIVALDLLLLSLARTHCILSQNDEDARKLFDGFRKEWSDTYRVQMND
jgi:hypothetical protein